MLHNTVGRIGTQSFVVKTIAFSGTGTLITLNSGNGSTLGNLDLTMLACGAVVGLWLFDTQYMRTERAIRNLIRAVKSDQEMRYFEWNLGQYMKAVSPIRAALSWSLAWFYLGLLSIIGAVAVL